MLPVAACRALVFKLPDHGWLESLVTPERKPRQALRVSDFTLYPAPRTQHRAPCVLHATPCTLHPVRFTAAAGYTAG